MKAFPAFHHKKLSRKLFVAAAEASWMKFHKLRSLLAGSCFGVLCKLKTEFHYMRLNFVKDLFTLLVRLRLGFSSSSRLLPRAYSTQNAKHSSQILKIKTTQDGLAKVERVETRNPKDILMFRRRLECVNARFVEPPASDSKAEGTGAIINMSRRKLLVAESAKSGTQAKIQ